MAITNGLYELRSMLNTGMCVDVAAGSMTKGANVQLYTVNGTNAQKFYLVDTSSGWSIQNGQSLMYVDVDQSGTANGTNVKQWTNNANRAQRWAITETGETETIEGETCPVVSIASYVTAAHNMMMDVRAAMTEDKTNIRIYQSNGTMAQRFALYPSELLDKTLAAPSAIGWVEAVYDEDAQETRFEASTLYPTWLFPSSWPVGSEAFAFRYRSRSVGESAGAWSDWTAWAAASIATRGTMAWLTTGLPASVTEKALEYQLQVRSTSTNAQSQPIHSLTTTCLLRAAAKPTASLGSAEVSYTGLALGFASDYTDGTNQLRVTSIVKDGQEILIHPVTIGQLGASATAVIDSEALRLPIVGGDSLEIIYEVGTDVYSGMVEQSASLTASYATGHSLDMTSTYTEADGLMLSVSVPEVGTEQVWTVTEEGMWPAYQTERGWLAIYPFGKDFQLYVTGINASGSAWGDYILDVSAADMRKGGHAWSWDGGSFFLDVVDGLMTTKRSISANGDAASLNSRAWQTVQYSDTLQSTFDAVGVIDVEVTEATKAQMMALIRAHHAIYRAPTGEVAYVGIDDIKYSSFKLRTEVTVQMTQETI